jgi:hypothetical protein
MTQYRRRPVDAVYSGPATKSEVYHAKLTEGIEAGLRAIYEPEDQRFARLRTLLQKLQQEKAAG